MDDTYNDLYPLQLKDPEIPVQEDCSNDTVPAGTTNMEGKKKVLVPELITMTKVLFDRYRLDMYTYLNNCLHTGGLATIVGKPIKTRVINHEICTFPGVTYWRIDRANFLADVTVELKLQTSTGLVDWRGCLTCWCGFDDNGLFFSIEDLDESLDRKDEGLDMLSPYLVPYATNKRVDEISEALWKKYLPEALDDPKQRIAAELVKRMGLTIEFHPVYEHRNVESIIFFKKDELAIGEDRKEKDANGKERHIKARFGKPVVIPANTIFEKENIRTDDPTSNFQLALLGAISQDESNSIGLNRRWAYQQRFANGDYNIGSNRILGYDGVDGKLVPNQDAWIIREIFERYVAGESYSGICRALAEKGAKTLRGGKFTVEAVRYILSNETYVGDKHLMKQPPTDYLTHQPMKRSDYKDYYLTDDHEGIVSRELWDRAQEIKKCFKENLKNGVMGAGEHHFLYGKVFCGDCGAPFVRRTLKTKGGVYYKAWNCRERQKGQKGNGCRCRLISEESLIAEIVKALGWEAMDEGRFNREVSRVLVSDDDVQVEC